MRHARRESSLPKRLATATALVLMTAGLMSATAGPAAAAATTLSGAFDNTGISADSATASADLDGDGNSLSATDLAGAGWTPGTTVTVNGTPYALPDVAPGEPDNVVADGQRISVTGTGDALGFLAAATHGPFTGHGTVEYRDGTRSGYRLTAADWAPADPESAAVTLPHTNGPAGPQAAPVSLYAVTVPISRHRRIRSVTLPDSRSGAPALHVFAIGVRDNEAGPRGEFWTGSWAAPFGSAPAVPQSPDWKDQTLRMVIHPNAGGGTARIRFANTFAPAPVRLGHATVAVQAAGPDTLGTPVTLTFGGSRQTMLPAGGEVYSDPVGIPVTVGQNLLVSIYLPDSVSRAPTHSYALTTSYTSARSAGDHTADPTGAALTGTFDFWTYLSAVDVATRHDVGTVVALGDSQTDGGHSTADANLRWPDDYARLLTGDRRAPGVINSGISGNRLLTDQTNTYGPSALNRLDRDVFAEPDVRTVVLYEGINDISLDDATPAALEAGIEDVIAQAHARGIRVVATTIPAFEGYSAYTPAREMVRSEVNTYIRTARSTRGYVDFDLATRDPDRPTKLLDGLYDPADHLHFNDTGCMVLAETLADGMRRR